MTHPTRAPRRTLSVLAVALLSAALVLSSPGVSNAAQAKRHAPHPLSHTVAKTDAGKMKSFVRGTAEGGRTVRGTFTPHNFVKRGDKLFARGKLHAVIIGKHGHVRSHITKYGVRIPVKRIEGERTSAMGSRGLAGSAVAGSCDVLNLVLGPLDLNLLGLEVHLQRVVLDVIAVSGAGNLLGNLLCAVAGLLDGGPLGGLLGQITALLDRILGALRL